MGENLAFYERISDEEHGIRLHLLEPAKADSRHIAPHFHHAAEWVIVEKGKYRAWVNGDTFTLGAGDVLFVESGIPHSYEALGEAKVHVLIVSSTIFGQLGLTKKIPRVIRGEHKCQPLFTLLREAQALWLGASEQYKLGVVYSFVGVLLRGFVLEDLEVNKKDERFAAVLRYIEENFRQQISLDALTEKFGYSKSYFSRTFNKLTGVNLREYLNRRRIREALHIKSENPHLAWVHITVNVGFESWSTFARAYKRYRGTDEEVAEGNFAVLGEKTE